MGSNSNLFKITFMVSLVVHSILFLPMPEIKKTKQKEIKQLDFNYLTLKMPVKKKVAKFKHKKININDKLAAQAKKPSEELPQNSVVKKQDIEITDPQTVKNVIIQGDDIMELQKKQQILTATDDLEKKELAKNKSYISYYKLINEQLRQAVIYPAHFSEGEISLSFILESDGKLKDVEVMQTASIENEILKETAMQIVKRASPFPPFPKTLQQKQLTFNIVFCFKESS